MQVNLVSLPSHHFLLTFTSAGQGSGRILAYIAQQRVGLLLVAFVTGWRCGSGLARYSVVLCQEDGVVDRTVDWSYFKQAGSARRLEAIQFAHAQLSDELEAYQLTATIRDRCLASI